MPPRKKILWHSLSRETVIAAFKTDAERGLTEKEYNTRLAKFGKNVLRKYKKPRFFDLCLAQFKNPLALILFIAGSATFVLGSYLDTIVIFIALAVNVAIGAFQEYRASRAFAHLQSTQKNFAVVIRDGGKREVNAETIVPGDILVLEAGQSVVADARLLESRDLSVNEAIITGEWLSVKKDALKPLPRERRITEQSNMAWSGTLIASGYGTAVVVATGSRTQSGIIASRMESAKETKTPLQKNIHRVALWLSIAILVIVAALTAVGILFGNPLWEMLLVSVAIAVAAVPSGLPAAVTVVLALGMESILKKGGLMRSLLGTETLGSTTVILTDKTGTLTEAKMSVSAVATVTSFARLEARGGESGGFLLHTDDERETLMMAVAASDAFVEWDLAQKKDAGADDIRDQNAERVSFLSEANKTSSFVVRGRPLERAIIMAGIETGILQEKILVEHPRTDFLSFASERQFAASVHKKMGAAAHRLILVGAPEYLFPHAEYVLGGGKKIRMTKEILNTLADFQEHRSKTGERLAAVAYKDTNEKRIPQELKERPKEFSDSGLVFAGFLLFSDPIRADAKEAVTEAQEAGIRVIMVTGDNPKTAAHVAAAVGILEKSGAVIEGSEIAKASDKELSGVLLRASVFARVLPEDKKRLVEILQKSGEIVAMTGDGVNDAPALKSADIGIALGSGTEVAKEASDLVLLEDGMRVLVHTISVGRTIVNNLKKIVAYLLSTSFSEIFVVSGAILLHGPLPLLPTQILWINIIEESFMNFAYAFEPEEPDTMRRDPRNVRKGIFDGGIKTLIAIIATVTGGFLIGLYIILNRIGVGAEELRTIMFAAVAVDSIFFSVSLKNFRRPVWRIPLFSNKYFIFAVGLSIGALAAAFLFPPLRLLLSLAPFSRELFFIILGLGIINVATIETAKYFIFATEE